MLLSPHPPEVPDTSHWSLGFGHAPGGNAGAELIPLAHSSATACSSPWKQPCRSSLPQDLVPGLLQPVHSVALQGREDGSEGGEVLQDAALLRADKEITGFG